MIDEDWWRRFRDTSQPYDWVVTVTQKFGAWRWTLDWLISLPPLTRLQFPWSCLFDVKHVDVDYKTHHSLDLLSYQPQSIPTYNTPLENPWALVLPWTLPTSEPTLEPLTCRSIRWIHFHLNRTYADLETNQGSFRSLWAWNLTRLHYRGWHLLWTVQVR